MKVVYVGDNRNRGNFGCRATSTALSQLISEKNEIVGVVSGKYTNFDNGELFFHKIYTKKFYEKLGKIKNWDSLKTGFYLFARMIKRHKYFFCNFDFIGYDLDKSIDNLLRCLPANPNLKEFDLTQYDFDALVVNGEGSFIFATPPWRECLVEMMLMHWALKMGKKVYYLNGMLSDDPYTATNMKTIEIAKELFAKCEVVQIREYESLDYAKKYFSNSHIELRPDALFTWYKYINDGFNINNGRYFMGPSGATDSTFNSYDFTKEYICVAGSSSLSLETKDKDKIVMTYCNLVNKLKTLKKEIYVVEVCEGDYFLREVAEKTNTKLIPIDTPIIAAGKILANARAFVSGRYHPAILASLGGTPCVFMASNSHKTKSLQELLKYENVVEYPVLPSDEEIMSIVQDTSIVIQGGDESRDKIRNRAKELCDNAQTISELIK